MFKRLTLGVLAASTLGLGGGIICAAPASAGCTQIGYEAGPWGPGPTKSCTRDGVHVPPPPGYCDGWYYQHRKQFGYQIDPNVCY